MKKTLIIFIFTILITTTLAYSSAIYVGDLGQLGASEKTPVAKYNLRVYSVSITVDNNQITGITINSSIIHSRNLQHICESHEPYMYCNSYLDKRRPYDDSKFSFIISHTTM